MSERDGRTIFATFHVLRTSGPPRATDSETIGVSYTVQILRTNLWPNQAQMWRTMASRSGRHHEAGAKRLWDYWAIGLRMQRPPLSFNFKRNPSLQERPAAPSPVTGRNATTARRG